MRGRGRSELLGDLERKVRVLKRVAHGDPLRGVEREQAADEVEELPVRRVHGRDHVLQRAARAHVLLALPRRRLRLGPVEARAVAEELGLGARARAGEALRHPPHDLLHHREVLEVVVRLVECDACVELDEDAPQREGVARVGPAEA
jgi:hypothetical protein